MSSLRLAQAIPEISAVLDDSNVTTLQANGRFEDLEFSDLGRDARFGPGWWIMPFLALGAVSAGAFAYFG